MAEAGVLVGGSWQRNAAVQLAFLVAGFVLAGPGYGQETSAKPPKIEQHGVSAPTVSEKQKKLLEDSEKLVTMAAELKVSVDKSSKNELSLDVVRKAEALEKLARSVKERIREAH